MKYFGYGTLLTLESMQAVAPNASIDGVMRLDGFALAFGVCSDPEHAGCTLRRAPDAVTYGVQYDMSSDDMARLDRAAHVADGQWVHRAVTLVDEQGNAVPSSTYVIPGEYQPWAPTDAYVVPIYRGLDVCSFPDEYKLAVRQRISEAQAAS